MYTFCLYGGELMILMQANRFRVPLEGVGPENQDILGPAIAPAKRHF
jgi:hypothetical protein